MHGQVDQDVKYHNQNPDYAPQEDIAEAEDFWKEKDKTFYEQKEDYERSEEYANKNTSQEDQISRKTTFSLTELAKKREWINKMKKTLQDSKNEHFVATSPEAHTSNNKAQGGK
uniref:Uncharacterized protein n=1 Tax=Euplotes crassus TaxID=5936 RepID=A0A7S3KAB5_EUPCR|mmetsp:Transcript_17654/g.17369  ORF Transcript_17654/g.17369 Transcript_17654/m.17369 type:complete len:114 (+) Transcript_17654:372-713(+)